MSALNREVGELLEPLGDYETLPDWQEAADVLLGMGVMLNPSE